jgi:hypothetical protein
MQESTTKRDIVSYIKELTDSRYIPPCDMAILVEAWKDEQKLTASPYQETLQIA